MVKCQYCGAEFDKDTWIKANGKCASCNKRNRLPDEWRTKNRVPGAKKLRRK